MCGCVEWEGISLAAALTKRILDIYKERERDDYMIKANVVCVWVW